MQQAVTPQLEKAIAASIEIQPKQVVGADDILSLFPRGLRVYLADLGIEPTDVFVEAARRIKDAGCEPVPHIAARRLTTHHDLEKRLRDYTQEGGVRDILIIGGGLPKPAGDFSGTMDVLETGLVDKYGISEIGVAGHPEGSPDFSDETALELLKVKKAFADRTGAKVRIVTQFGFDAQKLIEWSDGLGQHGVDLPVHLGVAGPAKLTTILKYVMACGVGNSLNFLKKRASSLALLTARHSPEEVVAPIERHAALYPSSSIKQIHIFPFGGVKQTTEWLNGRGSWAQAAKYEMSE